jgi:hypothetical protein
MNSVIHNFTVIESAYGRFLINRQPRCRIESWKLGVGSIKQHFEGLPYQFFPMNKLNLLCARRAPKEAAAIYRSRSASCLYLSSGDSR